MKKKLLLFLMLILGVLFVRAQDVSVTGKVVDSQSGKALEGISIVVKGQKTGTSTTAAGTFTIRAKQGSLLVLSSINYVSQEVPVTSSTLSVALVSKTNDLDAVVVVGFGTQKKVNLTGSVTTLKNEELTRRQVSTSSNLLQGLAPGVTVTQQSGRPGADGASINIRGLSSIYAGQGPLILVDGVVSSLDNIDANAIESITILKDAASTAVYGSRAANGVILVSTKRAKGKELSISYNSFYTKQKATNIPERASALDFMKLSNVAQQNSTGNPNAFVYNQATIDKYATTPPNNLDVIDNDWVKLLFTNSGFMQNQNVNVSAGGENLKLFASATYLSQDGLIPNTRYTKTDIRINPDLKVNDKLSFNAVLNFTQNNTTIPSTNSPEFIIREAIGLIPIGGAKFGDGMYGNAGQSNNRNPLAQAEAAGTSNTITQSTLGKIGFTYKPITNIDIEAFVARESSIPNTKTQVKNVDIYQPNVANQSYDLVNKWPGTNSLSESYSTNIRTTYQAQASYTGAIKEHNFKFLAGVQNEQFSYRGISASRTDFTNQDLPYLNLGTLNQTNAGGAYQTAIVGFFGRFNYNYKEKYLLEANGRYDGSSRFSQTADQQWGFFPSASAGWVFSKEHFFEGLSNIISFGKFRASYGSLGNQALSSIYPFAANYTSGLNAYFNGVTNIGYTLLDAPNPNITWEKSKQKNIGLDLTFAKYFTFTGEYYIREISNILLIKPIPTYVGLNAPYVNAGTMENRGYELTLNFRKKIGDFGIDVTGLFADSKNKVTSLPGVPYLDGGSVRTAVGQSLFSYFGYQADGYFQSDADIAASPTHFFVPKPGDIKYKDLNGDGKIDPSDRTFIGNNFPRYEYSLNANFSYKNFELGLFFQGVGKKENYISGTGAYPFYAADFIPGLLEVHKDYWTPDNPNATFPRLLPAIGVNGTTSSFWVKNSAYLRLKNVNLSYKLPETLLSKLHVKNAKLFVSGQNLFTITKFWEGFDPEVNNQNGEFYPLMKTITAGINVNF
ncbi:SusC/RagA family TonB-linked outer membrane protein [Pedobacter petrophilus]|uniref:SusC/RagA family TonB-linked outer membrane protein n=1 Tax=Pedobacter petrophilus TaxID=1908241 RepID=A0A7K0G7B5_9SPHI|nr:TonB-dependent receptor [Pedobacter petrophilus]MRX78876.1 SusC/RagA family TonB-linked outer membrane protein [Pedobacter petrophilus]